MINGCTLASVEQIQMAGCHFWMTPGQCKNASKFFARVLKHSISFFTLFKIEELVPA